MAKSKLTPELQAKLCDAIRAGNYYGAACAYAGIDKSTFYRWLERGKQAKRGKYCDFCNAVSRAELQAEARMVTQWQAHMPKDYRAIRDFLERRFPERWGKQEKLSADFHHRGEVTRHEEHEITIREEILDDPESRELAKQLVKRQYALKRSEDR